MRSAFVYSIAYAKYGAGVWFSHLDTIRILDRAIRRAGLPVVYTQGFNPHIRLSTRRALPLGLASAGEWITLRLQAEEEGNALGRRLDACLPAGFSVVRVQPGAPPAEDGSFRLELRFRGDPEAGRRALDALLVSERYEVERRRKGPLYRRDVRPFFREGAFDSRRLSFNAGPHGERRPSPGDLALALRRLAETHGLEVVEILLIPPGFVPPGRGKGCRVFVDGEP